MCYHTKFDGNRCRGRLLNEYIERKTKKKKGSEFLDVFEEKEKKGKVYQQLAKQDLLSCMFVTLDTTQLLMSALNTLASLKAVAFGRRKKKGLDVKWPK